VTGVVVDEESGQPVSQGAWVSAHPVDGSSGGHAQAGADGRFSLELDPGKYKLRAGSQEHAEEIVPVEVTSAGVPELRFELGRGLTLGGNVIDAAGQPVPQIQVMACSGEGADRLVQGEQSGPDGTFRLRRLLPRSYNLVAGSAGAGFGLRAGVSPGDGDIVVSLRPAARVRVTVLNPDGTPAIGVQPRIVRVGGASIVVPQSFGMPGTQGVRELAGPAGALEIEASAGKSKGTASLTVGEGGVGEVEIKLLPAVPNSP
jgi:hypothetical protein